MRNLLYPPGISRRFINSVLILMGSVSFLFFMPLKSLSNREIIQLSQERFDSNMPGFQSVLKSRSFGKWFELETALCIHDFYNEKVLGFNLDINITSTLTTNNNIVEVLIPGLKKVELRGTEYDVVTDKHVFECKSGKFKKRINMRQFLKERNLIEWFKVIKGETITGSLNYRIKFTKKGKPILVLNGISTLGKDICLSSNWLKDFNPDNFYDHWSEIIELLSTKKLQLVFKQEASKYIYSLLYRNSFDLDANFSYAKCSDIIHQNGSDHLTFHHGAL